ACAKPEQPLYTARKGADVWQSYGDPIPVDTVLAAAPEEDQRQASSHDDGTDSDDWLDDLLEGDNIHTNALRVVGRMVTGGMEDSLIRKTFQALRRQMEEARGA